MKKTSKTALSALALGLGILGANQVAATDGILEFVPGWQSGNAAFECEQAGDCGAFALKIKEGEEPEWDSEVDGPYFDVNGEPGTAAGNIITISNNDGVTFDWTSEYKVCTVIVKAGNEQSGGGANIYRYPGGSCGDTGLVGPLKTNTTDEFDTIDISHVSFCWSDDPCDVEPPVCYQEETAWANGTRYNNANWAMYVRYYGLEKTVDIYAGQHLLAGTATFSAPSGGFVDITIELNDGVFFSGDDENVKIQDYTSKPGTQNPKIGLFSWKETAPEGGTSHVITVRANSYYAVHLDVAVEVECDE